VVGGDTVVAAVEGLVRPDTADLAAGSPAVLAADAASIAATIIAAAVPASIAAVAASILAAVAAVATTIAALPLLAIIAVGTIRSSAAVVGRVRACRSVHQGRSSLSLRMLCLESLKR
jgi:hypothetical protein